MDSQKKNSCMKWATTQEEQLYQVVNANDWQHAREFMAKIAIDSPQISASPATITTSKRLVIVCLPNQTWNRPTIETHHARINWHVSKYAWSTDTGQNMRDLLTRVSYIGGEGVGGGRAFALYYHNLPHNFFRNKRLTASSSLDSLSNNITFVLWAGSFTRVGPLCLIRAPSSPP